MAAALDWRRGRPAAAAVRGDELARELGIEPGPELGQLLGALEEAAFAGEAGDRAQAVELARSLRENPDVIVDCAVYEDGERRDGSVDLEHAYQACHEDGLRLDRAVRADRGGVRLAPRASSSSTRSRSRTRSTPTSGRSSRSTATCCSWC